ncbi:MAG TPA: hypothetical protein ENI69_06460 [Rhodospirillales bacterium]|nr:hypothetical protein [Rhodospirillales bacterium]
MSVNPAVAPAHFNLAVETLKQTLRREKQAATAISQALKPPDQSGVRVDVIDPVGEGHPGGLVNISA